MSEEKDLPEIMAETMNAWSENVEALFYDRGKEVLDYLKTLPPSPPREPDPWEDDTPFDECNWFVYWGDEYEEHVDGFKTKKKALLYMRHVKWERGFADLIKGKVVK